jgi:uncharacterized protein (DUF427 family)
MGAAAPHRAVRRACVPGGGAGHHGPGGAAGELSDPPAAHQRKEHDAMPEKSVKLPGPEHPITIVANPKRVIVKAGGKVIADTTASLTLREAAYPPVHYIPRADVDMAALTATAHSTYCPYKGDCSYFSIPAGGERSVNAVWSYEKPFEAVAGIKDHLAFYPSRVDAIEE